MENLENIISSSRENFIPIILDDSAKFLVEFCSKNDFLNVLEIGTAVGYSGILILNSSKNAKLTTIEKSREMFDKAKVNFEKYALSNRVNQILGDAKDVLEGLEEKYDFIFLDGPKGQYIKYLPNLLKLLKPNGYLLADNVFFHDKVKKEGFIPHKHRTIVVNLRNFINEIMSNPMLESEIIEIGDGLTLSKLKSN